MNEKKTNTYSTRFTLNLNIYIFCYLCRYSCIQYWRHRFTHSCRCNCWINGPSDCTLGWCSMWQMCVTHTHRLWTWTTKSNCWMSHCFDGAELLFGIPRSGRFRRIYDEIEKVQSVWKFEIVYKVLKNSSLSLRFCKKRCKLKGEWRWVNHKYTHVYKI